jgi:DNA-binding CsgD family transcriptional regulator
MAIDDDELARIIGAIEAAPFSEDGWHHALSGTIRAGGGWGVQMVAQSLTGEVHFDIGVEIDPEIIETYEQDGTSTPALAPRTAAALAAGPMATFCEADFITPEERDRHPMYQEVHLRWNAAYVCGARLNDHNGMLTGLGVLRSEKQGHTTNEERRAFAQIVPHLDAAFRLQMQVESQAAAMAAGMFETIDLPVAICDQGGRVTSLSPKAQDVILANDALTIRNRRLAARQASSQAALDRAIALAGRLQGAVRINRVRLRDANNEPTVIAEVAPLPRTGLFGIGRVMVLLKPVPSQRLRRQFGLTASETEIVRLAMKGDTNTDIAAKRGTSVQTVRSQLRTIYSKLDVRSRSELILRMQTTANGE